MFDGIKGDLEDKIRRLEEDRHNIDISSDLWNESQQSLKKKKSRHDPMNPDRRRKPVTVTDILFQNILFKTYTIFFVVIP